MDQPTYRQTNIEAGGRTNQPKDGQTEGQTEDQHSIL